MPDNTFYLLYLFVFYLFKEKEIQPCLANEKTKEEGWVEHSLIKLGGPLSSGDRLTWAAYHASDHEENDPPALTALLPLFYEKVSCKGIDGV